VYPDVAKELDLLKQTLDKYFTDNSIKKSTKELRIKVWEAVKKLWK
jgi:hypothetical protein